VTFSGPNFHAYIGERLKDYRQLKEISLTETSRGRCKLELIEKTRMQSSMAGQALKARPISRSSFRTSTSRGSRLIVQAKIDLQGGPRIIRGKCFVTRDVSLHSILTDRESEGVYFSLLLLNRHFPSSLSTHLSLLHISI
jgi:hypothetical protein